MAEVCILLATYNGERFLAQQLDSLLAQDYRYWHLIAADDRSTDATPQILADFAARLDSTRVKLRHGPGRGVVANFLT
ncbi:MAG: glycosyltransferase, partial [Rhodocyclaceae bacterium]